jgi:hypothetical protein
VAGVDVLLEECPAGGCLVDVDLLDVDAALVQETPGILAGRSRRFCVEDRLCHIAIVPNRAA